MDKTSGLVCFISILKKIDFFEIIKSRIKHMKTSNILKLSFGINSLYGLYFIIYTTFSVDFIKFSKFFFIQGCLLFSIVEKLPCHFIITVSFFFSFDWKKLILLGDPLWNFLECKRVMLPDSFFPFLLSGLYIS